MPPKPKEKSKLAAAAAPAPAVAIEDLFTSLNRHIQRSEFDLAVKVSDQALGFIKLRKAYHRAYCFYRQNRLDEALETLKGQEGNFANMLLQSQILFRLGKMDACVDIFQKLQKSKIDSLEINLVAGLVSAGRASEVQGTLDSLRVKPTSSFELAYNVACSLIERNLYKDAEQLLLSSRRIGQETLVEENLADDDIELELAPIAVQLAYVQQIIGRTQEAFESYSGIIKKNLADESSLAVSISNLIALKGPKDVSDGLRKLDKLIEKGEAPLTFQLARGLDLKLSLKQREAIYVNRLLLLVHSNKLDQARELASALPGMFPNSVMPVLLQAAVHVRENKANKAEELLWQFANKYPDKSKVILLARAQVAAAAGHPQIAAESLLKIPDIQHKPATVATLVSLKERAGDIDGADAVLESAIRWWSNAMTEDNKLDVIMQEAASFKLRHGKKDEAARLYEELVKSHGSIEALVGLIQTAAHTDIEKAESYEKQLKPIPGLKGIDVESLEKTSGAKHTEKGPTAGIAEAYEPKNKEKTKKKRKRKPKYPKGFDPANPGPPPDPERWLPKRERSSYRPKRKDKRAAQIRGSQGAVVKEADSNVNPKSTQAASSKGNSQNTSTAHSKPSSKSRKKSRN
ncbi:UNVERIFIED_CONTAM: Signal recognition particle subunit SRP72 [Sesamum radiatum]|uniref:Signal recognition particle subunit SRP72 n=1 Tax=Sesamum radiatum TaxID=300843 RepID=A0AAW2UND1_SESRA